MKPQPAVGGQSKADRGRVWKRRVAASIPAGCNTKPPLDALVRGVEGGDTGASFLPGGGQRIKALGNADAVDLLAADRAVPVVKGVPAPDLQTVHAELQRQPVHKDFLQDCRLRHAKPRNAPAVGPLVWMAWASAR